MFSRLTYSVQKLVTHALLSAVALMSGFTQAKAEMIALSLPISGEYSEIGRNFSVGAKLAMEAFGKGHELFIADDGCDPDLARLAAGDFQSQKPAVVTGILCNEVAVIHANVLREAKIPLLVAGARSVRLTKDRNREDWHLWQMAQSDIAHAEAIASHIVANMQDRAFALIDDGTIYGRTQTDAIRLKLDEAGMKPQFTDSFRAAQSTQSGLLRRLERSGVEVAVIAAATPEDLFTIARDRSRLGIKVDLIMSEQLAILPFLEEASAITGKLQVMMPSYPPQMEGTAALTAQLEAKALKKDISIYEGYATLQVVLSALNDKQSSISDALSSRRFETILGPVAFDRNGKNVENRYKLHEWQDGVLEPISADDKNL